MRDLVPACAAGKVGGEVVLDPNVVEDNYGEADLPVAMIPRKNEISLLQMDGNFTQEEFQRALDLAVGGCMQVYELQKEALRAKYGGA